MLVLAQRLVNCAARRSMNDLMPSCASSVFSTRSRIFRDVGDRRSLATLDISVSRFLRYLDAERRVAGDHIGERHGPLDLLPAGTTSCTRPISFARAAENSSQRNR